MDRHTYDTTQPIPDGDTVPQQLPPEVSTAPLRVRLGVMVLFAAVIAVWIVGASIGALS